MIRSGFFNSSNNDRLYDAEDMGKVFEGIISDGVFHNIGEKFSAQKVDSSMNIKILSGKAWFYNKYFEIVDYETINISPGNAEPRIDRLYLEIDNSRSGRVCKFNLQQGIPNPTPSPVVLQDTNEKKYIVLYDFRIAANATNNSYVTITSYIGEDGICPWATTTLDPRRGLFLYDAASPEDIDPTVNQMAILSATSSDSEWDANAKKFSFNYPEGYTKDNCVVLTAMFKAEANSNWRNFYYVSSVSGSAANQQSIFLDDNKVNASTIVTAYACRVILMKVGD